MRLNFRTPAGRWVGYLPGLLVCLVQLAYILLLPREVAAQPAATNKTPGTSEHSTCDATDHASRAAPRIKAYPNAQVWTDANRASEEFPGFKWIGEYVRDDQALQVTTAEGKFYLSTYHGGLPGAGWDLSPIEHEWVDLKDMDKRLAAWHKIDRSAKVTGRQPPPGATILFDGSNADQWHQGKLAGASLKAGTRTKQRFQDFELYLEFLVPLKPEPPLGHPHRGNSGVFALGAYEIQIADTFGLDLNPNAWTESTLLKPFDTWCGSVYGIRPPEINMCLPPLAWQSLTINFKAARFRETDNGLQKISPAVVSVIHNGVEVHHQIELPSGTGGGREGLRPEVPNGPIVLQDHSNPNLFRNVWIVEKNTDKQQKSR